MADAAELEFLRRTLVEPGLLAPDRLDAWRSGWPGRGSFFAHLVDLGALARPDAGTLSAVFKGYVKLAPDGLLRLFKLESQPAVAARVQSSERPAEPVPADMSSIRESRPVEPGRGELRAAESESGSRSSMSLRAAESGSRSSAGLRVADAESAARSSPALRAAVAAAIDAALSGLPMEPEAGLPAGGPRRIGLPQVGAFVAGYQLRAQLGLGARGAVYRAWASAQGRSVVIKLMPSQGAGGLASAAAQAAVHGRLRHPGVLKVLAAGEEDDVTYLVFEDLYAISLATYLDGAKPLAPARIAQIGAEVAQTLAAGAALGIVHGDLKPAHVLVYSSELRVKLTDFLAVGEIPASAAYLAPERVGNSRAPNPSADMYSLGATLHHAATGRPPRVGGAAQPLVRFGFPAPLSRVVARLMHEQPGERFPGWIEAAEALLAAEPSAGRALADPEDMSKGTGEDRI